MSTQTQHYLRDPHAVRRDFTAHVAAVAGVVTVGLMVFIYALLLVPDPATVPAHTSITSEKVTASVITSDGWGPVSRVTTSGGVTTADTCGNDDFKVGDTVVVTTITYGSASKTSIGHAACDPDLLASRFSPGLWPDYPISPKTVLLIKIVLGVGGSVFLISVLTALASLPRRRNN